MQAREPVQRVQLQACYILHHRLLRETSVIADLLTPDHGRVSVVARGARSPKSKHRALLQPFRPLLASWSGRGELKTLTGLEEAGMPVTLNNLAMACAYYLNELLLRLLPPFDPNPEAFALYARTLTMLPESGAIEPRLRLFELQLLELLGLVPDFGGCVDGFDAPAAGLNYLYYPEAGIARLLFDADSRPSGTHRIAESPELSGAVGPVTADNMSQSESRFNEPGFDELGVGESGSEHRASASESVGVKQPKPLLVSGDTLLALANLDLDDPKIGKEAKHIMRRQLGQHLGSAPLKSREMLAHYASRAAQQ